MTPSVACKVVIAVSLACMAREAGAQGHASHARASEPTAPSPLSVPMDAGTRASLPRSGVSAIAHGKELACEGVSLPDLLRNAHALPAGLDGPALASYVLVAARNGHRVVYSLAELDPALGGNLVLLADRCNGQALADEDGPLRLIAPGESNPARWVRQVHSITVVRAP